VFSICYHNVNNLNKYKFPVIQNIYSYYKISARNACFIMYTCYSYYCCKLHNRQTVVDFVDIPYYWISARSYL